MEERGSSISPPDCPLPACFLQPSTVSHALKNIEINIEIDLDSISDSEKLLPNESEEALVHRCPSCSERFECEFEYCRHVRYVHLMRDKSIENKKKDRFDSFQKGRKRCRRRSEGRHWQCEECGLVLSKRCHLIRHAETHVENRPRYQCDLCPANYARRLSLLLHRSKVHQIT